jgi:ABC-type sulfate/molybdate transport systems ATPase subunit
MTDIQAQFDKRLSERFRVSASFSVPANGFSVTALYGPSGSGKTTILRCLSGLERPDAGRIACGSETWFDAAQSIDLAPARRRVGFLSQDYALFPHLTVERNVGYGLRRIPRPKRRERVLAMLERFDLAAASSSGRRLPAPSSPSLACCSWTSRFRRSTLRFGNGCDFSSGGCSPASPRRSCS